MLAHEEGLVAEAVARLQAATGVLRELSLAPSATLFAEHLRALTAPSSIPPPPPDDALLVPLGGTWFRAPQSSRVGLERRRPLAKIVERLAVERLERPGSALDTRALQAAAWPGEKILPAAAAHRVRVAISTLRKLGLPLVTRDDGYLFEPTTLLVRA